MTKNLMNLCLFHHKTRLSTNLHKFNKPFKVQSDSFFYKQYLSSIVNVQNELNFEGLFQMLPCHKNKQISRIYPGNEQHNISMI